MLANVGRSFERAQALVASAIVTGLRRRRPGGFGRAKGVRRARAEGDAGDQSTVTIQTASDHHGLGETPLRDAAGSRARRGQLKSRQLECGRFNF